MRSNESPMDFQYENPIKQDPNSPFRLAGLGKSLTFDAQESVQAQKRTWQESPLKLNAFGTPRQLYKNTFSTPGSALPREQHHGEQDDTPGTDATDEVFASDADSPLMTHTSVQARQGQSKRVGTSGKFSDLAKLKLKRRRQKHLRDAQQEMEEESEEDERRVMRHASGLSSTPWLDRDLPSVASGYLQLTFNLFLLLVLLYFLISFILTIQSDVNKKVEEYSAEILSEISQCSKEYLENRCSPDQRVPAMQSACQAWERCMERDPQKVGRARVSAETFAEIVNSFIEPISYKTMIFVLGLVLGSLFVSNFAFSVMRHKGQTQQLIQQQQQHQHQANQGMQAATFMIQATPHREMSGRRRRPDWS